MIAVMISSAASTLDSTFTSLSKSVAHELLLAGRTPSPRAIRTGMTLGVLLALDLIPPSWAIGDGKYATLLGTNLYGLALCTAGYFLPLALPRRKSALGGAG